MILLSSSYMCIFCGTHTAWACIW